MFKIENKNKNLIKCLTWKTSGKPQIGRLRKTSRVKSCISIFSWRSLIKMLEENKTVAKMKWEWIIYAIYIYIYIYILNRITVGTCNGICNVFNILLNYYKNVSQIQLMAKLVESAKIHQANLQHNHLVFKIKVSYPSTSGKQTMRNLKAY